MEQIAKYIDYMWPEFFITFALIVMVGVVITFGFQMKQQIDKDDED